MQKRGQKAPMYVREMLEVVLGLGGVTTVSWWVPVTWMSSHLLFCAFFIVVFAIAVRYRARMAYSASLLAACIYGMLLWLRPEMRGQPHELVLALEPFLLLISGLLTSDLLRWQRQRLSLLEQDYIRIDEALQQTQQRYQLLVEANQDLARQVAGQSTSLTTMSNKAARLWKLEGVERFEALLDLVMYTIEAQACALYLWRDDAFHLSAARSSEPAVYAPLFNVDDPVLKRVVAQREVVTVREFLMEQAQLPAEVAVMAGPLLNSVGEMIGVMAIDHMPLLKFTPDTVGLFRSLLLLVSPTLQSVQGFKPEQGQTRSSAFPSSITEPVLSVVTSSHTLMQKQ